MPGRADVSAEQVSGQPVLRIQVQAGALARYGVPAQTVLDLVEALGSKPVGRRDGGAAAVPVGGALPEDFAAARRRSETCWCRRRRASSVPLSRLADVDAGGRPGEDFREWGQRRIIGAMQRARPRHGRFRGRSPAQDRREGRSCRAAAIASSGAASSRTWSGADAAADRGAGGPGADFRPAVRHLSAGWPTCCWCSRRAVRLVGGVLALWAARHAVLDLGGGGFIALSGVSVLNSMVLVSFIRQLRDAGCRWTSDRGSGVDAVASGADDGAGGQPGLCADGAEHGRRGRSAAPAGDGRDRRRVTSTLLTLLVLPVLYRTFGPRKAPGA